MDAAYEHQIRAMTPYRILDPHHQEQNRYDARSTRTSFSTVHVSMGYFCTRIYAARPRRLRHVMETVDHFGWLHANGLLCVACGTEVGDIGDGIVILAHVEDTSGANRQFSMSGVLDQRIFSGSWSTEGQSRIGRVQSCANRNPHGTTQVEYRGMQGRHRVLVGSAAHKLLRQATSVCFRCAHAGIQ